ncbi:hypothetical protein MMC31_000921 [Peltigera leucophlebia]|nr:hypothetical protein [Peltigera leucophlebia]
MREDANNVDTAPISMRVIAPKVILVQLIEFHARPLMEGFRKKKLISPVDPLKIEEKPNALVSTTWTPRPRIVEEIFQRALRFRIVLFRGTPASGKTILMKLIHRHVLSACPEWVVHTFCGWPQGMNIHNSESQKFLIKKLKVHPLCAKNTLVFIDDAESSYYDENLWSFFKLLELDSAMFILFSSYGSPGECPNAISTGTSPVFAADQMISLHKEPDTYYYEPIGILLEKDEVEDLVARFLKAQSNDPHLEEDLTAYLRLISGGHAGALVGLLETVVWDPLILAKCARNGVQFTISLADFVEVFQAEPTSKRLRKGLKTKTFARGIPLRKDVQSDPSIADFLNEMAKRGSIQVSAADTQKLKAGARTAYLRGWVHKILDDYMEVYIFASPIHYWHCQALLRNHSQTSINAASPLALAIEIIKHMEPYKFALPAKNANPHSTSLPLEDWYNKEFYRASERVLDGGVLKSPEFGITGVKGGAAMDFYLGSKKWGIELTRDGDRLYEHCSRFFQGGGNYHKWIVDGTLLDWLVLDFRSVVPSTKHSIHICFVKAFSQVKILSNELETLDEFALINT